jgi:hypothetical protein
MESAKVQAGDKEVQAKITVTSEANKIQLDKVAANIQNSFKKSTREKI